jgi:hypothetical protein
LRARWLAPVILLTLAGCGPPPIQAEIEARQAAMDPPQLWRVQSLGAGGAVTGEVLVCADTAMRTGFDRASAEADGRPCVSPRAGVEKVGLYANRCELDGRRFGLTVNRAGDPEQDFTLTFALRALDGSGDAARQTRRFRRLGGCPAEWRIGDQAKPGAAREFNALEGTWGGR